MRIHSKLVLGAASALTLGASFAVGGGFGSNQISELATPEPPVVVSDSTEAQPTIEDPTSGNDGNVASAEIGSEHVAPQQVDIGLPTRHDDDHDDFDEDHERDHDGDGEESHGDRDDRDDHDDDDHEDDHDD